MSAAPRAIYLDHNATTPILVEVVEAMTSAMRGDVANPSSLHRCGRLGRAMLEESRERLAAQLGGTASEFIFTSGGTEANQLAVLGVVEATAGSPQRRRQRPHAVVAQIEHPSTLEIYRRLESQGRLDVSWVGAGGDGRVEPESVASAITDETVLVSLLHANNETGVLQNVGAVAEFCRARGVPLHCDAVQSLGKVPFQVADLGADLVSFSAHKIYGPKGSGALWVRSDQPFRHPFGGGPQERGRRPGTENLPAVVGFACAVEHLKIPSPDLRDQLLSRIQSELRDVDLNGSQEHLVANTLNVSFGGVSAELLLIRLDMAGVQASSGSACASGAREPSHVLTSMGLSEARISSAVRFSLGRGITADDIDRAADILISAVDSLRR